MTNLPETKTLITELENEWLTIWFNTPQNRNALSEELVEELTATLNAIKHDRSVRGITLRGKGGVFCAGGDLKGFMKSLSGDLTHAEAAAMNKTGGDLFELIDTMPQVTIALVEGAAIAGGLGIVCCADVVAVTKDAKFALTETQLGITPAQIAPYVARRLGFKTARRLMLTGARFKGVDAKEVGLADYIAEDADDLTVIANKNIHEVMLCAPSANAATKEILLATRFLDSGAMKNFAAERFANCITSDEGLEGVKSFIEKRKPSWANNDER